MLIATPNGMVTVDGWCYMTVGFRHTEEGWVLTHLPTGMAIRTVPTRPLADSLAQRLDPLLPHDGTFGQQPPSPPCKQRRKRGTTGVGSTAATTKAREPVPVLRMSNPCHHHPYVTLA